MQKLGAQRRDSGKLRIKERLGSKKSDMEGGKDEQTGTDFLLGRQQRWYQLSKAVIAIILITSSYRALLLSRSPSALPKEVSIVNPVLQVGKSRHRDEVTFPRSLSR